MNWCWFTGNKWNIISCYNYIDTSFCRLGDDGAKSNTVTLQCEKCGNLKPKTNYCGGFIDKDRAMNDWRVTCIFMAMFVCITASYLQFIKTPSLFNTAHLMVQVFVIMERLFIHVERITEDQLNISSNKEDDSN